MIVQVRVKSSEKTVEVTKNKKTYSHPDDHTRQATDAPEPTVFLKTTLTQTITLDKQLMLLGSNHLKVPVENCRTYWSDEGYFHILQGAGTQLIRFHIFWPSALKCVDLVKCIQVKEILSVVK